MGTKFTAAYGLVVLLALARRPWRIGGVALGAVAGSYWYAVNLHDTGHILGDQTNVPGLTAPFQPPENVVTAYGDLVDLLDLSGASGKYILIFVAAAVVLVSVLALRHTKVRDLLLAGAVALLPLPVLLLSDEVGRPSLLHLYDLMGKPQAYLAVGDDISSSPTTASDTASWFGPAGLLLVVATAVAAARLWRRRSLPRPAAIFAFAPLLWLVLVALTLTYHPWQGRFYVFPIALSAALWGLVLRVRPAAWAVVVLAATTAVLSLVHYVEKPADVVWEQARWQVQSQHDPPVAPVLRFLDENVPPHASIGLALGANQFGYPAFGPHLARKVKLVPFGSSGRDVQADWIYADPERAKEIDAACWRPAFQSESGTVFKRSDGC
jgi:hypothetical protein